ncbi:MAG: hypothetical protein ACJA2M_001129 [Polaribacter sp.]|jgi:hypothetical protein
MELFIEKEFLEDFEIDFDQNPIKEIVKEIITSYGDKRVYINYNQNNFAVLKVEYEFFALICNTTVPLPVESIETSVKKSNCLQTLVFTKKEESWHKEMERKGAWCFSFDNYEFKIKELIDKLHIKVDLSIPFNNWNALDFSTIPFNSVQITDGYILKDEKNIKENLIPLIASFVNLEKEKITIDLLVKEIGFKTATEEKKKEFAKKQHGKLNSKFSKLINLKIYLLNLISDIDLHDRTVVTNFSILDSGVGFSVVGRKRSNSQMTSASIFEKYTYNRLRGLRAHQQKYINKLNSNSFQSLKFYKFP